MGLDCIWWRCYLKGFVLKFFMVLEAEEGAQTSWAMGICEENNKKEQLSIADDRLKVYPAVAGDGVSMAIGVLGL
jgi:hypothetical protein